MTETTETIKKFVEIYFYQPENKFGVKPHLTLLRKLEKNYDTNSAAPTEQAAIFAVHQVTEVINGQWPVKSDKIFLFYNQVFYLLEEKITIHKITVKFPRGDAYFQASPEQASFSYALEDGCFCNGPQAAIQVIVPKKDWQLIQLKLKVKKLPAMQAPQKIRESFIGEEFPLELNRHRPDQSRLEKDGTILISTEPVTKILEKSSKKEAASFYRRLREPFVAFNYGCYHLF